MTTVPAGNYKISNGAQGPGSTVLYLTFPGSNVPLTVNPLGANQVWTVTGSPGMQAISPQNTGFQANGSAAGQYIQATTNPLQWNINYDPVKQLFTIQTLGMALDWDLAGSPSNGQSVILASPSGNYPQYWKFTPA